ncbi:MAG: glycerol-3-phosphate acyltransferase [Planctomycetes bacterium]|nr:glycerol-3-phosphate acyltransferase [Planctomycetota bacterium]
MFAKEIIVILLSYTLGCVATGYYIVKFCVKKDIRQLGTGTIGARNVGRILGKKGFAFTITADALKGATAVFLCTYLNLPDWALILSMLAVTAGHIFPVQLSFHGGKGIGVTVGALLLFDYYLAAGLFLSFALLFLLSRNYMLSGIIAIIILPITAFLHNHSHIEVVGIILLVTLVLFAHRKNIQKLFTRNTISIQKIEHQDIEL